MSHVKVSVIINCYNGESFLKQAIDSIYAQSYQDWEIIFWDNASTDRSAEIAQSYDSRLKYYQGDVNVPLYAARNFAIEKAQGSFITFLDCDDWWQFEKLSKQVVLFEDPDIGFCISDYWVENELRGKRFICKQTFNSSSYILDDLLRSYTIGVLTLMIRKQTYDELEEGFNADFDIIGDFDLVIRLSAITKVAYIKEALAHYRRHSDNLYIQKPMKNVLETEDWYHRTKNNKLISGSNQFFNIPIIINYSRAIYFVKNNKKKEALRIILKIPLFRKEFLRLIIALMLPKFLINILAR